MPNKNYISGRRKEYKVKKDYDMMGFDVLRTAGSHGFADLIAINRRDKKIVFIQCKPNNFSKSKSDKLYMEYIDFNMGVFDVSFKVI